MRDAEKDFKEYLEKYCRTYNKTPKEAIEHKTVQDVKAYYEEEVLYNDTAT